MQKYVEETKRIVHLLLLFVFVAILSFFLRKHHRPVTNNGKKWRVAYYEGGTWVDYDGNLRGIIQALMEKGWLVEQKLPKTTAKYDTRELWSWLSEKCKSDYISFVGDAYWSCKWKNELRKKNRAHALNRLANGKDLDLVIAAGTWAGQDLATKIHDVSIIVISASNPVQSRIIKSVEDPGFDHVFAKVDPERYLRQLRLFHSLTKFKKLGVIYEDTIEGRSYAAIDEIYTVAKERGFQVINKESNFSDENLEEIKKVTLEMVNELAPKIDAFYITDHRGQTLEQMKVFLEPLHRHKVRTWAQSGVRFVERGALYSTTKVEYEEYGRFYASVIAGLFNGQELKDFNPIFEDPKSIAVNLKTAKKINYDVPPAILNSAEIYPKDMRERKKK